VLRSPIDTYGTPHYPHVPRISPFSSSITYLPPYPHSTATLSEFLLTLVAHVASPDPAQCTGPVWPWLSRSLSARVVDRRGARRLDPPRGAPASWSRAPPGLVRSARLRGTGGARRGPQPSCLWGARAAAAGWCPPCMRCGSRVERGNVTCGKSSGDRRAQADTAAPCGGPAPWRHVDRPENIPSGQSGGSLRAVASPGHSLHGACMIHG
jgi:hypothetical protein